MHRDSQGDRAGGAAGEVVSALQGALSKIVVGDPRLESVRMGPLASLAQKREVLEQVREASQ